jgi:exopolyphosphatase/guanosine-5'-triphosphate,3'-diphosphate pyrophosphatase
VSTAPTRVAAVDCGTNSLRLLIAAGAAAGPAELLRRSEIVRLGAGVDANRRIAPDALARTLAVLDSYAADIERHGVQRVRMVATSATRDAGNRDVFAGSVRSVLGVEPEVITGLEEASLSFAGATRELDPGVHVPPHLVVDIGGGSTEFVLGSPGEPLSSVSVDIGCVRLTERHLRHDPPTTAELASMTADIDEALNRVELQFRLSAARTLVGVAGTVTTVAGIALDLPTYQAERIHLAHIDAAVITGVARRLAALPAAARAALPVMHPGRVDVIVAGAVLWSRIVERAGVTSVVASEHDILDGVAAALLEAAS